MSPAIKFLTCFCIVGLLSSVKASESSNPTDKAIQFLTTHKAMRNPAFELGRTDQSRREAAKELFKAQIESLIQLRSYGNASIIPILVPYLNYKIDGSPTFMDAPYNRMTDADTKTICEHWPAFATILSIPNSGMDLIKYISNTTNPIDTRVAAFHVLRYIDLKAFQGVSDSFFANIAATHPSGKDYLQAIINGTQPFSGIYPIDASN